MPKLNGNETISVCGRFGGCSAQRGKYSCYLLPTDARHGLTEWLVQAWIV